MTTTSFNITSPHIFILDLDNTIIGDIKPQVILWEIAKASSRSNPIKFDQKAFQEKLLKGRIVRPGFSDFIRYVQSQGHLVYVYTASEKSWATFVISQIEKALHIKFEKPIFTRKNCQYVSGAFRKNTQVLAPAINRSLKSKGIRTPLQSLKMTIIDNLNTYHALDQNNLVVCPSYDFKYPENIGANISYDQFRDNMRVINSTMEKYVQNYQITNDYWLFQKRSTVNFLLYIADMNRGESPDKDGFFSTLTTFMKSHPKHIFAKYINKHVIRSNNDYSHNHHPNHRKF